MNKPYRILVIAPYEGFRTIFEQIIEGRTDISVDIYSAALDEIPDLIPTINTMQYEAAICRGRSGRAVQELINIPVINVDFSPFDILRGLELASLSKHKHMAFVSFFETRNTVRLLCDILKLPKDLIIPEPPQSAEEMQTLVENLHKKGVDFFIGDGACVRSAKNIGAETLLITSGPECLKTALEKAIEICKIQRKYVHSNSFYKSVLKNSKCQNAIYNENHELIFTNLPESSTALLNSMVSHLGRIFHYSSIEWIYTGEKDSWKFFGETIQFENQRYAFIHITPSIGTVVKDKPYFSVLESDSDNVTSDLRLVANNNSIAESWNKVQSAASLMIPILISGSYCTGKITFAHAVYAISHFSKNSLIEIDCQALDERSMSKLIYDENSPLFEYNCMILFKNLESMPISFQKDLANIISTYNLIQDLKIVSTINGDLNQLVLSNRLLQDLAAMLNGYTVRLPSLQETPEQIVNIGRTYLNELNQELPVQIGGFEPEALKLLQEFNWEFGITQFKMVLKQVALSTTGIFISADNVRKVLADIKNIPAVKQGYAAVDLNGTLEDITGKIIEKVLEEEGMNQSRAAKRLGISRGTIWKHLRNSKYKQEALSKTTHPGK